MRRLYLIRVFSALLLLAALRPIASAAELKQKTTAAFDRYVAATEARFANELRPGGTFLYIDGMNSDARQQAYDQLKRGEILVEKLETKAPGVSPDVPDGIVHHWVGLIFIPGATLAVVMLLIPDIDLKIISQIKIPYEFFCIRIFLNNFKIMLIRFYYLK